MPDRNDEYGGYAPAFRGSTLVLIDLQNGFMARWMKGYKERVERFLRNHASDFDHVIALRFVNIDGSPFEKQLGWYELKDWKDIDLIPEVKTTVPNATIVDKGLYDGAEDVMVWLRLWKQNRVYVMGVDTEACVYATAMGLFDHNVETSILFGLCTSGGDVTIHENMLPIMQRTFGEDHVIE